MFSTEKQLVKTIKSKYNYSVICNWEINAHTTKILEEVDLGFGIADIVISNVECSRIMRSENSLNYFDIGIYKIIESNASVSFDKIKEITRANKTTLQKSLSKLMIDSYINQEDSLFQIRTSYQHIISNVIAVEAKLRDWKRAVNQAFRYKWFAKKSFVILDSVYIKPALANICEFEKLNVGLAEINKKGIIQVHFNPIENAPIDEKMWILINEKVRKSFFSSKK